jgi:hypothetical protein
MGPYSEGLDSLQHPPASLLADTRIVACLCAWLAAISVGMAALWFDAPPARDDETHTGTQP